MADSGISGLPVATSLTGTEAAPVVQSATTKQVTSLILSRAGIYNTPPIGAITEIYPRIQGASSQSVLATGRLSMAAIRLFAGQVVANITFASGSTPLSAGSNQWFALFDSARAKLRVTSDDTSTAWGAQALKTLALTSSYTVPTTGLYYVGIVVVATTPPTLTGLGMGGGPGLAAPAIAGNADSSLTNPASCPSTAASLTTPTGLPWGYVS